MTTALWIVAEGDAAPLTAAAVETVDTLAVPGLPVLDRHAYGSDWVAVEADDAADALSQADAWDHDRHPALTEMRMFAAAYRNGALSLLPR